jgi:hypothetical protein
MAGFAVAGSAVAEAAVMVSAASGWAALGSADVANSAPKSVVTCMAGLTCGSPATATVGVAAPRPHKPGDRTATPASLI